MLSLAGGRTPGKVMAQYQPDSGWIYQCDDIVIDPRAHRLERAGLELSVEPKTYAVLVMLLQHAGDVVGKDDLLDAAWGHRHVTPGVLTRAVSQLRHALGDSARHPRYIATVHRLGYRFVGDVRRIAVSPAPDEPTPDPPQPDVPMDDGAGTAVVAASARPAAKPEPPFIRWLAAAITLVVIVAMLAAASLWHPPRGVPASPPLSPQPALVVLPFAHTVDSRTLRTHYRPHNRRIATSYPADHGQIPAQVRASGYLTLRPEQAPASQQ
jgi:DNA-binding winged helix-turn-helix (wHTH) protein